MPADSGCDLPGVERDFNVAAIVRLSKMIFAVALVCSLTAARAFAHGDVHPRILEFTEQIKRSPTNTTLYIQRAELYRIDGDYTNALADLNHVAQLDRKLKRVDFLRGQVQLEAGQPQSAITPLNRYLADQPPDAEAYTVRARVLVKLNRHAPAIEDYTQALKFSATPNPELYIERAAAWRTLDKPEEAIRGLDEGIRRLGPIVTLQLPAVDAELALKHTDAALARIDTVMSRLQRKETWLVRRAEILRGANREAEARTNYFAALEAINRLPASHRGTRMTLELESRIRASLATNATIRP